MKRTAIAWLTGLAALMAAPLAWAENLALLIVNEQYQNHPRVNDSRYVANLQTNFQQAGFEVLVVRDLRTHLSDDQNNDLWRRMNRSDRLVVVLSGHVVRTLDQHWLLGTAAGRNASAFGVGRAALSLDPIMDLAQRKPGNAIVAIGMAGERLNLGWAPSHPRLNRDVPQGVLMLAGGPRQVAQFIAGEVLQPGRILAEAARTAPDGLLVTGYLPFDEAFLPRGGTNNPPPGPTPDQVERQYWNQVVERNTVQAYRQYLNRYPGGRFAPLARNRIAILQPSAEDLARAAENALNLNRNQKRQIQRHLHLLGYRPGGVDGLFGSNTRAAIKRYQAAEGTKQTGYLNLGQVNRLANLAQQRARQLEREAEERRREAERQDRNWWNQTGAGGSEQGLRRYLQRYPDGLFAAVAKESLAELERQRRRQAAAEERDAWNAAVMQGTIDAYQGYISKYPDGKFVSTARARIEALQRPPETKPDQVDADRKEEERLSLNGFTRQLIEVQLRKLNYDPGKVDGRFTRDTRRALRKFQRANNMPVTGYVTRDVVVLLLASAVDN